MSTDTNTYPPCEQIVPYMSSPTLRCKAKAVKVMYWPGGIPVKVCAYHEMQAAGLASTLGFTLHFTSLDGTKL